MTTNNSVNVNLSGQTGTANFVGSTAPTFTTSWAYAASGFLIKDNNGNTQISFTTTASAVNFFNFTNSATGVGPTLSTTGTDSNVNMLYQAKGTGNHVFSSSVTGNPIILTLAPIASGVNSFSITSATTGNGPTIQTAGTDSNINMTINTKGTGSFTFTNNGTTSPVNLLTLTPSATPVNYLTINSSNTGVSVPITATGSDSNISIALNSKGTGGIAIKGFSDASAPAAGTLGEFVTSTVTFASPVTITTSNTAQNVTSISLTAGDWDVWGNVGVQNNAVAMPIISMWASTTSATLPALELINRISIAVAAGLNPYISNIPTIRVNVSTTTTVYLSTQVQFSSGTQIAWGTISARRAR